MGSLLSILGSPVSDLITNVGNLVRSFVTTDADRLKASQALLELQTQFQAKLVDADTEFAKAQAQVVTAEVQSQSWLARNWRPIVMLEFAFIIGWNFIVAPVFSVASLPIPTDMWELIKIGMGGYIIGRSAEKVIPGVVAAVQGAKAPAGDKSVPK